VVIATIFVLLMNALQARVQDPSCEALSDVEKVRISEAIKEHFNFPQSASLDIWSVTDLPGSCYKRLKLRFKGTDLKVGQDFYLSADHRFLSLFSFDLKLSEPEYKALAADRLRADLRRPDIPKLGLPSAPISVALFADFQCPYCRNEFAAVSREIVERYKDKVVISFHHLPLPMHNWAKEASVAMACVSRSAPAAFWPIAEWIFQHQDQSFEKIGRNIIEQAVFRGVPNTRDIQACISKESSEDIISHDQELAKDLSISRTPTLLIEGERIASEANSETIERVINKLLLSKAQ